MRRYWLVVIRIGTSLPPLFFCLRRLDLELIGDGGGRNVEHFLAVERELEDVARAEPRAVDVFGAIRVLVDDEAVKIRRRIGHVAHPFAIRPEDLQPGLRVHDADVNFTVRGDGEIAVHVADDFFAVGE